MQCSWPSRMDRLARAVVGIAPDRMYKQRRRNDATGKQGTITCTSEATATNGKTRAAMRQAIAIVLLVIGWSVLTAQTLSAPQDALPSVALPPEIDRVLRDYESAWQARDAAALAALFAEDGFVMSNGKPPVRGRLAIKNAYSSSGGPLALRAFAYSIDGTTGYIIGAYAGKKDAPDEGKFILALNKDTEGRWLIAADIDNTNSRPKRPAASPPQ